MLEKATTLKSEAIELIRNLKLKSDLVSKRPEIKNRLFHSFLRSTTKSGTLIALDHSDRLICIIKSRLTDHLLPLV
jgi:hypothetical protein